METTRRLSTAAEQTDMKTDLLELYGFISSHMPPLHYTARWEHRGEALEEKKRQKLVQKMQKAQHRQVLFVVTANIYPVSLGAFEVCE